MFSASSEETCRRKIDPASIPDEDISVRLFAMDERITAEWTVKGIGFGQFSIDVAQSGSIKSIDSETMSKEFIKRLLCWTVDKSPTCDQPPAGQPAAVNTVAYHHGSSD
jgi:hypothetical protein